MCQNQYSSNLKEGEFIFIPGTSAITKLSIEISTISQGLVLYTLNSEPLAISCPNNKTIRIHVIARGGDLISTINHDTKNGWVKVELTITRNQLAIRVNNGLKVFDRVVYSISNLQIQKPIYIGDLHSHSSTNIWKTRNPPLIPKSINGCIRNLKNNEINVALNGNFNSNFGNDPQNPGGSCDSNCFPSPCTNGICDIEWLSAKCFCHSGWSGTNCTESLPISFNGINNYLLFTLSTTIFSFENHGSISFRMLNSSGTILSMVFPIKNKQSDYIRLFSSSGSLNIQIFFNNINYQTNIGNYGSGNWHKINWLFINSTFKIIIDNRNLNIGENIIVWKSDRLEELQIFLGGEEISQATSTNHFSGCLQNFEIGDKMIPFAIGNQQNIAGVSAQINGPYKTGCEAIDSCKSKPCRENEDCINMWRTYKCVSKADPCTNSPCLNNGTCVNTGTSWKCNCPQNADGNLCQISLPCSKVQCQNNGICKNIDLQKFQCTCLNSWYGETCEFLDKCRENPCKNNGTCIRLGNDFNCSCTPDWIGEQCEVLSDVCKSFPCQNSATCTSIGRNYRCSCQSGWTAKDCNQDIIDCKPNICKNGGRCIEGVNSFTCDCSRGFEGKTCEQDKRGCPSNPCRNLGTCIPSLKEFEYTCKCSSYFEGKNCEQNIDDCKNSICRNGSKCKDGLGNYTCECLPGYGGQYCTDIIDSCFVQPCKNNGKCLYTGRCSCSAVVKKCGWYDEACQIRECVGSCTRISPSYFCDCSGTGYTGSTCEEDVNECSKSPCLNSGDCANTVGSFRCSCQNGWTGNLCEHDIDECSLQQAKCLNEGTCLNTIGSYKCICPANWTGTDCKEATNPCASNPCGLGSICVVVPDSFRCNCNDKMTGPQCQTFINFCDSVPCKNGGTCTSFKGDWNCTCPESWTGEICDVTVAESSTSVGLIVSLTLILLIILIALSVFYLWYRKRNQVRDYKGRYLPRNTEEILTAPVPLHTLLDPRPKEILV